jgi:hypothetical protein
LTVVVAMGVFTASRVAGAFAVDDAALVHVAVGTPGTVAVNRGRFIERSGLIGEAK